MVLTPKYLPSRLIPCNELYSDEELRNFLEITGTKCADDYGHNVMCIHFITERKSAGNISKAIIQLEITEKMLREKGRKLREVLIICKNIDKSNSRIYERKTLQKGVRRRKYLFDKLKNQPVFINKRYPIEIVYINELRKGV